MRAIAERRFSRTLAAAEKNRLAFGGLEFNRGKGATLMRPIAKRLVFAEPASAPKIGLTGRHLDFERRFLNNMRFTHDLFPLHPQARRPRCSCRVNSSCSSHHSVNAWPNSKEALSVKQASPTAGKSRGPLDECKTHYLGAVIPACGSGNKSMLFQ